MKYARRAAFVDRDVVLNVGRGCVHRVDDLEWLPGAAQALQCLQAAGYLLIVVTNRSGIARGMYTEADLERLQRFVSDDLKRHSVTPAGNYACPHHPEAVLEACQKGCICRKPRPELILRAAADLGLDPSRSRFFGDKASDVEAGRAGGVGRCWLIGGSDADEDCAANGCHDSLVAAAAAQLEVTAC